MIHILAESSNRPLTFYRFSWKPKAILHFYIYPQTDRCVSLLRHQTVSQNSLHYIQGAPMNTGTPIFTIHKIQHFDTIRETSLVEIANFMSKTTYLLKNMTEEIDQCRNEHSSCITVVALGQNVKTYTTTQCMQIFVHFENGVACIHRCLLDAIYWIMENLLVVWCTSIFAYLGIQT